MYIYDPSGRLADSSNNGDVNNEQVDVTGGTDPMGAKAGIPAGQWTIEVRGWLVTTPEPFTGKVSVTYAP